MSIEGHLIPMMHTLSFWHWCFLNKCLYYHMQLWHTMGIIMRFSYMYITYFNLNHIHPPLFPCLVLPFFLNPFPLSSFQLALSSTFMSVLCYPMSSIKVAYRRRSTLPVAIPLEKMSLHSQLIINLMTSGKVRRDP